MAIKHRKYKEDDFDLDLYIREQTHKAFKIKVGDQSRKILGVIKVLLIIAAFITAFELYSYASHLIEVWRDNRINETARFITRQSIVAEREAAPAVDSYMAAAPSPAKGFRNAAISPVPALSPVILGLRDTFGNNDIVAYLKIEGTNIDFPVAQTINNSYYLTHDLLGRENAAGSAFMDYEGRVYPLSYNTVIYAHNMRDGSMFHDIRNYNNTAYFEAHKKISLQTLNEDTLWEIFSFYETDTDFYYNAVSFADADDFVSFANMLKEKSIYKPAANFTADSRILTLSTCTNRSDNSRYVLHAYRVK